MPDSNSSVQCNQCPRKCGSNGTIHSGFAVSANPRFCSKTSDLSLPALAKVMVHHWEEPCISGEKGSGALFFAGCNLGCAFCQNQQISSPGMTCDKPCREEEIIRACLDFQRQGCHNINFVTGSHSSNQLGHIALQMKRNGVNIPFVWNSSAYETPFQIRGLERAMDVYLPDLKFYDQTLAANLTGAANYFDIASKAILEMYKQKPNNKYSAYICNTTERNDNTSASNRAIQIIQSGLIIRHLVLPGFYKDSIQLLEWIEANLSSNVSLSLMSQYIPDFYEEGCKRHGYTQIPSLQRRLTTFEYDKVVNRALSLGFSDVYIQERAAASKEYVPDF